MDYDQFPELKLFQEATNSYPPAGIRGALLPVIIEAIQDERLERAEIATAFTEWVAHGFKPDNLSWLREWAPAVKRGERPWERKSNGNGSHPSAGKKTLTDADREESFRRMNAMREAAEGESE